MNDIVITALYKFVTLEDYSALRAPLLAFMQERNIRGTLLLACEGINGTVAGRAADIEALYAWLERDPRLADLHYKESHDSEMPFYRSKVKLKKEIVTLGVDGIDPRHTVGTYVEPEHWDALIADPDVLLIDTRNDYEVKIGTFEGAVNPKTGSFRDFPAYVEQNLDPRRHKKVAMFCTGGIRCEKSTALLKQQGFSEVYHLNGGILNYLEKMPEQRSSWRGECFVFDNRVSVDHQLQRGHYEQCHACRMPITREDMASDAYQPGLSCPHCIGNISAERRHRFAERQKQIQLSRDRNEHHIGCESRLVRRQRKAQKLAKKARQRGQSLADQPAPNP